MCLLDKAEEEIWSLAAGYANLIKLYCLLYCNRQLKAGNHNLEEILLEIAFTGVMTDCLQCLRGVGLCIAMGNEVVISWI